jgi:hypothetical protein
MFIIYYKIDRNKQSKITIHETDILNSHFTEHFYRQSRLTAVEQITFHDTKIKHPGNEVGISHFTRTNIDHSRLTKIPFPTLYAQRNRTSFFNTCMKKNSLFWPINVEISFNTKTRLQSWPEPRFRVNAYFHIYWSKSNFFFAHVLKKDVCFSVHSPWEKNLKSFPFKVAQYTF